MDVVFHHSPVTANYRFYSKVVYIHRLEFLCDFVKDGQVEVPEFVWEHDQELESRPLMDYGLDVDPLQYNNMDALGPPHSRLSFRYYTCTKTW